jgi:transcriptional regulator with XRE-family HTH domain
MLVRAQQNGGNDGVLALRHEAGKWLRGLREKAGISQRELAKRVGIEYYTFISQIEAGRGRIPPGQIKMWAEVLDVVPRRFAIEMMRYYDPHNYDIIFGVGAGSMASEEDGPSRNGIEGRLARLERLLGEKVAPEQTDEDETR